MAKYSKEAQEKIGEVMDEWKRGDLRIGKSSKKVTSQKQAVAIGIDEARRTGKKVPPEKK